MASSSFPFSLSSSLLLLLIFALIPPTFSTSRGFRHPNAAHHLSKTTGFRVSIHHLDSVYINNKNLSKFEKLQSRIHRGKFRAQRLSSMVNLAEDDADLSSSAEIQSQVHSGSGEFLMKLSIGTPAESFSAIMDTGSDLIWTQCHPCTHCYNDTTTPIFDPNNSTSFSHLPCSSDLCTALPSSSCGKSGCEYSYTYGDYSSTQGVMGTETFTFGSNAAAAAVAPHDGVSIPKLAFGCGADNEGDGFQQASGLVGLGRGPLSLASQLDEPMFSYCLTGIGDTNSSSLLMGSLANPTKGPHTDMVTTRMIKNPSQPSFYYLSLEGISVGHTRLGIDKSTFEIQEDGTGGLIIDSGTTLTYLEQTAYDLVRKEFVAQVKMSVDDSTAAGLDLCFRLPSSGSGSALGVKIPKLVFHFVGGADLELPGENYIIADSDMGLACLAMGPITGMSIFGNIQQQNLLVLHDLKKETLSFLPTDCSQL